MADSHWFGGADWRGREFGAAVRRARELIVDSWSRSAAAGLDADVLVTPVATDVDDIAAYRAAHPLSQVFPLLYDVLRGAAQDCNAILALGDTDGKLLWVRGRPSVLRRAERINFIEGSVWDEDRAGTNAPGTALRLDTAVQISAGEHYARLVQGWSCAAVPIHDPETQAVLGVVDVTGGDEISSPQTLAMMRAAARMAESELARIAAARRTRAERAPKAERPPSGSSIQKSASGPGLRIEAHGRPDCRLDDGSRVFRLSQRHSDIVTVLAENPEGITGDELAIEVYEDDVAASTVRAELVRLRALLGESVVLSRPYRLNTALDCDWLTVVGRLAAGDVRAASGLYRGPLLPHSVAPSVVDRRERLHWRLRAAVLASQDAALMAAWTGSRWGAEDLDMWMQQIRRLPSSSPLRPMAVAEARRLDLIQR